jgi:hypothetical protein
LVACTRVQEIDLAEFAVDPRAPAWAEFRDHYPRCAECSREVAGFATLKMALAGDGAGASAHPSESELLALATPSLHLASDERVRLEAHLAGCAPCRTELAVARGFDFAAVSAPPRRPRLLDWLGGALVPALARPALLAAAVVVLAVPAGVLIWRRAHETRAIPSSPTAEVERGAPDAAVAKTPPQAEPEPEPRLAAREEVPAAPVPAARPQPTPIAKQPPAAKPPPQREALEANPPEPPRPLEIAALLPTESPLYAPGPLANGASVRIESAVRSLGAGAPAPEALAPAHVGASAQEFPNLYWFLPEATSSPVDVTVIDPAAVAPLLETRVPGPLEAGVHRVSLAEHGTRLQPGVDYRWFVTLVRDHERRSQDVVSGAAIRYTPPGPEQRERLSAAPPARVAHLYAESGYWYDAFDQLSSWLAAEPGASLLHSHRAALLEQVGLGDAAAFERRSTPGGR